MVSGVSKTLFVVTATFLFTGSAFAAERVRTVALSDQPAPGTPADVSFFGFGVPSLNSIGQAAFRGFLSGDDITSDNLRGIWSEKNGSLTLIARAGNRAPGTPDGVVYRLFSSVPQPNSTGQTAFRASLLGNSVDSSNDLGIWTDGSGMLTLLVREGNQAPGMLSGVNFRDLGSPVFHSIGSTAFFARLTGTSIDASNDASIWSDRTGALSLEVQGGTHAPGTPPGVSFGEFGSPLLTEGGQLAFNGFLSGTGINFDNDEGIWSEKDGSLTLVAREGNEAPGTADGTVYGSLSPVSLNSAGQVTFRAFLNGSAVDNANNVGIWSEGGGSLVLVARTGDEAPEILQGGRFSLFHDPTLSSGGHTAFSAKLTGAGIADTDDSGIWSERQGSLSLVAREGSHAPGTPSGVNFGDMVFSSTSNIIFSNTINAAGQVAFLAELNGAGVGETNDQGIWATNASGDLRLIAREGDDLEVFPGQFKTVSGLIFASGGGQDTSPKGFNDRGQLAFLAEFTDGTSGLFVSNLVAIPEPSTLSLAILVAGGLGLFRRQEIYATLSARLVRLRSS